MTNCAFQLNIIKRRGNVLVGTHQNVQYSSLDIVVAISKANPFYRYDGTVRQEVAKHINVFVRFLSLFDRYNLNFLKV